MSVQDKEILIEELVEHILQSRTCTPRNPFNILDRGELWNIFISPRSYSIWKDINLETFKTESLQDFADTVLALQ